MRKISIALIIGLVIGITAARAQGPQNINTATTTCPGTGCYTMTVGGQGSIGIQITGTWTGTLTFYGSVDGADFSNTLNVTPSNSTTATTTATGNGLWGTSVAGLTAVRVLVTTPGTGTATVNYRAILSAKAAAPGSNGGGGGGGGTPAAPNTSVQFNNSGAFGGSASLTWNNVNNSLTSDSYQVPATDTGPSVQGSPTKVLLTTATGSPWAITFNVSSLNPTNYTAGFNYDSIGGINLFAGLNEELEWSGVPTGALDATVNDSWAFYGDVVDHSGVATYNLGRANNPWKAAYAELFSSSGEVDITSASGAAATNPGSPIVITAGDGNTTGTGGSITLQAGGSGSGTAGDIVLNTADFIKIGGAMLAVGNQSIATGTTVGNDWIERAYDTANTTYRNFTTYTAGAPPTLDITGFTGTNGRFTLEPNRLSFTGTTAVAVANVGANSCGTTAATIAGNESVGIITVGATSGTQCRVTFTVAATTRRYCMTTDESATLATRTTYVDTTHTDFLGAFGAGAVIPYICFYN